MKILIIDDDEMVLLLLREMLDEREYEVITAKDGYEGIAAYGSEQPDLVLLDVHIPGLNGCQVARDIKAIPCDRFVPIIFISSSDDAVELAHCIDEGGDDLIPKPFNWNILEAKLRAWKRNLARIAELGAPHRPSNLAQANLTRDEMNDLFSGNDNTGARPTKKRSRKKLTGDATSNR